MGSESAYTLPVRSLPCRGAILPSSLKLGKEMCIRDRLYALMSLSLFFPLILAYMAKAGTGADTTEHLSLIHICSGTVGTESSAPESLHLALSVWCAAVSVSRTPESSPAVSYTHLPGKISGSA